VREGAHAAPMFVLPGPRGLHQRAWWTPPLWWWMPRIAASRSRPTALDPATA